MMWALGAFIPVIIPIGIRAGSLLVGLAAAFAAASYDLGRRTDRVQKSSRVREAIRDRVSDGAVVRRLGLGTALSRFSGSPPAPAGQSPELPPPTIDPTIVAPRPQAAGQDESVPINEVDWGVPAEPHVSSGDGVWVAPTVDETTEMPAEPTEEGQFRLWD
jgi:hypothetical protein